jgi:hypothetical protein
MATMAEEGRLPRGLRPSSGCLSTDKVTDGTGPL